MDTTLNAASLGLHVLDSPETEQVSRSHRPKLADSITSSHVELFRRAADRERRELIRLRHAQQRQHKSLSVLKVCNRYSRFLSWCRRAPECARPTIFLSPIIVAPLLVVGGASLHLSPSIVAVLAICTGVVGLAMTSHLFLFPSRQWLVSLTNRLTGRREAIEHDLADLAYRYRDTQQRWRDAQQTYSRLRRILTAPRRKLLAANWRDMKGTEFERFVGKVFEMLGYHVEFTPATGDGGADLFLSKAGQRGVVQVKGWRGSVGNKALQEACYAERLFECDWCAVVTNSTFTAAAIREGKLIDCKLIDAAELETLMRRAASG